MHKLCEDGGPQVVQHNMGHAKYRVIQSVYGKSSGNSEWMRLLKLPKP